MYEVFDLNEAYDVVWKITIELNKSHEIEAKICKSLVTVKMTFVRVKITLCVSKSHFACENHTLHVEITQERVEITLMRVEITLGRVFWKNERVLANIYLKIDTHACEFHTQKCHFHKFACRIYYCVRGGFDYSFQNCFGNFSRMSDSSQNWKIIDYE
jgi:hypothetical protein